MKRLVGFLSGLEGLTASFAAAPKPSLTCPPILPGGKEVVTYTVPEFRQASVMDFLYYPEPTWEGNSWSVWGDSLLATNGT